MKRHGKIRAIQKGNVATKMCDGLRVNQKANGLIELRNELMELKKNEDKNIDEVINKMIKLTTILSRG